MAYYTFTLLLLFFGDVSGGHVSERGIDNHLIFVKIDIVIKENVDWDTDCYIFLITYKPNQRPLLHDSVETILFTRLIPLKTWNSTVFTAKVNVVFTWQLSNYINLIESLPL